MNWGQIKFASLIGNMRFLGNPIRFEVVCSDKKMNHMKDESRKKEVSVVKKALFLSRGKGEEMRRVAGGVIL